MKLLWILWVYDLLTFPVGMTRRIVEYILLVIERRTNNRTFEYLNPVGAA